MTLIQANARSRVDQGVDVVLKSLKLKKLDQADDEVLLTTGRWRKHYKANKDRINLNYGLLFKKCYGKLVASYTTKVSFQNNKSMMYSGACREKLESTTELPSYWILIKRSKAKRTRRNWSGNDSFHVNIALRKCELIVDSPAYPCKTSHHKKMQCELIWCRN